MAKSYRGKRSQRKNSSEAKRTKPRCESSRDDQHPAEGVSRANDIAWYSRNPDLLIAAGQLQYVYRPGMRIPTNWASSTAQTAIGSPQVESVLAIDWLPFVGESHDTTSAISIAAQEMYTKVRKVYSGELEADAPDMMMYVMALDSIFTYIGWLKRVFRSVSMYSPNNMAFPSALTKACGLTDAAAANIRREKDKFWLGINELIRMTYRFKCPAVMDIFNRHYWMSDNVYTDAASEKAQLYVYNLCGVYQLNPLTPIAGDTQQNTAAGLKYVSTIPSAAATVDELLSVGDQLIKALSTWSTGYTIAGYLQRAYEGVPDFSVALLMVDELITATYSTEVLSQIENVFCVDAMNLGLITPLLNLTVAQSVIDNAIIADATVTQTLSTTNAAHQLYAFDYQNFLNGSDGVTRDLLQYVNVHSTNPQPADSVIATRMHACVSYTFGDVTGSGNARKYGSVTAKFSCGTEIPVRMRLCTAQSMDKESVSAVVPQMLFMEYNQTMDNAFVSNFVSAGRLDFFDWHPLVYQYAIAAPGQSWFTIRGDVLSICTPTVSQLAELNRQCVYSEFNAFAV